MVKTDCAKGDRAAACALPLNTQMTDQNLPTNTNTPDEQYVDNFIEAGETDTAPAPPPPRLPETPAGSAAPAADSGDGDLGPRLERLGGEPAPVITPEEFARLQKAGQVHIDSRGRVRTARRTSDATAGVSLRKRRAWYGR